MAELMAEPVGGVRAVHRALRLLSYLGPDRQFGTLSEFTRYSGLATSTVQRLLQTLESEQFLKRQPDGRYTFGTALTQLAMWALKSADLYGIIQPYLDSLSRESCETANLGVWNDSAQVVYVRQALSPHSIRHVSWLGRPFPPEHTSMGMVLNGKGDEYGCAWVRSNQWEPDVTGIAAPIYGDRQSIIAGLNITGPTYRIADHDIARYAALVTSAAREISACCGGSWPHKSMK